MRNLLLITAFLLTNISNGKDLHAQTPTPINLLTIEDDKASVNHFSSGIYHESSYIDTADKDQKTLPKPAKKKRHLFAISVLGLAGTFVAAVIIFIVVTGGWEFKY